MNIKHELRLEIDETTDTFRLFHDLVIDKYLEPFPLSLTVCGVVTNPNYIGSWCETQSTDLIPHTIQHAKRHDYTLKVTDQQGPDTELRA